MIFYSDMENSVYNNVRYSGAWEGRRPASRKKKNRSIMSRRGIMVVWRKS